MKVSMIREARRLANKWKMRHHRLQAKYREVCDDARMWENATEDAQMERDDAQVRFANLDMHTIEQRKRIAELEQLATRKDHQAVVDQVVSFLAGALVTAVACLAVWNWGR